MSTQRKAARTIRVVLSLLLLMPGLVTPAPQQITAQSKTFAGAGEGFAYQ